jgi:Ca2+-binding EF-hand superfamily protein
MPGALHALARVPKRRTIMKPRNLLAIALTTALLSPVALAEKGGVKVSGNVAGNATAQAAQEVPRATLPPQVNTRATDAVTQTTTDTTTAGQDEAPMTTPKAPPIQAQGAAHAAAHSDVVQRDVWAKLDTDGDGQISTTEGEVDADFKSNFDMMDANDDGLVSDSEYRLAAKTTGDPGTAQGAANASSHSAVAMRDVMTRLDVNGDGMISTTEGEIDATFKTNFSTIDADGNGLITDAEYRAYAKDQNK